MCELEALPVLICLAVAVPVQCFPKRTITDIIPLGDNNSVTEDVTLPNCPRGSKINLISYTYCKIACHYSDDCEIEEEETLSDAAEYFVHQKCSWREKCEHFNSFPMQSPRQKLRKNAIKLTYSCIDRMSLFINMCEEGEWIVNGSAYLTIDDNALLVKTCECHINNGTFMLNINDARFMHQMANMSSCSPAVLLVYNKKFTCDASRDDFGSVFHRQEIPSAKNAFISVIPNSRSVRPDMIMLRLSPEANSKITCFRGIKELSSTQTSTMQTPTRLSSQTVTTLPTTESPEFGSKERIGYIVVIVLLVILVLLFRAQIREKFKRLHCRLWANSVQEKEILNNVNGKKKADENVSNAVAQSSESHSLLNENEPRKGQRMRQHLQTNKKSNEETSDDRVLKLPKPALAGGKEIESSEGFNDVSLDTA